MAYVERQRGGRHLVPMHERHEGAGWTAVCRLDEIEAGRGVVRVVNGTEIALMRDGDTVFALGNLCPHRGGQIGDGHVEDGKAICPLHAWDFDLRTGISPFNPADTLPTYPVRVRDGQVEVDADLRAARACPPDGVPRRVDTPRRDGSRHVPRPPPRRGRRRIRRGDGIGAERAGDARPAVPVVRRHRLPARAARPAAAPRATCRSRPRSSSAPGRGAPCASTSRSSSATCHTARSAPTPRRRWRAGASAAGTAIASGEGGAHPREREHAERYIFEMASGYFGWNEDNIRAASAIEVKIGQGAKPGLGGTLLGSKVTAEIAEVRGVAPGTDVHSPAHFPDISSLGGPGPAGGRDQGAHGRRARRDQVRGGRRRARRGCGARVRRRLHHHRRAGRRHRRGACARQGPRRDPLARSASTGRAGSSTTRASTDVQLVATGGFRTPDEMAKALALGADAVALATASLMAIGCQQYRACHSGGVPGRHRDPESAPARPARRRGVGPPAHALPERGDRHDGGLRPHLRPGQPRHARPIRPRDARRRARPPHRPGVGGMTMTTMLKPLPAAYARTLADLHRLAVYVVSPAQRLVNGEIIMQSTHGGFSTFEFGGARRPASTTGWSSTARRTRSRRCARRPLRSGSSPTSTRQEQFDVPPHGDLDEPLAIDLAAAAGAGDWFEFATEALERLRAEARARPTTRRSSASGPSTSTPRSTWARRPPAAAHLRRVAGRPPPCRAVPVRVAVGRHGSTRSSTTRRSRARR